MGSRLKHQRRGKGTSVFKAKANGITSSYLTYDNSQKVDVLNGQVVDLVKETGRNPIMAKISFENNETEQIIAAEGIIIGQSVQYGVKAEINIGNTLPLESIPEGCPIFNIEKTPGDGGKFIRSSGSYALLTSKDGKYAYIKMPSTVTKQVSLNSRATIGCVSGGGRTEKPFVKAGNKWHFMRAKSRPYPTVRGVAMNAEAHPFGGSQHHAGKSKSTSRHAHPGRMVGNIASKRTGRKKKN